MDAEEAQELIRNIKPEDIHYQCTFCKEVIEGEICGVVVVRNWDKPPAQQAEQLFFSHKSCFEKAAGETVEVEPDEEEECDDSSVES